MASHSPTCSPLRASTSRMGRTRRSDRRRRGADTAWSSTTPGVPVISALGVRALLAMLAPPVDVIYEDTARATLVTVPGISPGLGNSAYDVSLARLGPDKAVSSCTVTPGGFADHASDGVGPSPRSIVRPREQLRREECPFAVIGGWGPPAGGGGGKNGGPRPRAGRCRRGGGRGPP